MPYITLQRKKDLLHDEGGPKNAGELNYTLTEICIQYWDENGSRYQQINDIIGALEGCKLEFYRRLVAPYEDKKIAENGDVYS